MNNVTIRDLYAGKPDAKDEINFDGVDNFIKTYVIAEHFNLDSLIEGTNCFITGFKGTGKTALRQRPGRPLCGLPHRQGGDR